MVNKGLPEIITSVAHLEISSYQVCHQEPANVESVTRRRDRYDHNTHYSLSDSGLAIAFSTFLWQNVRVCHPNLANQFGALLRVSINIPFVSAPQNVNFAHWFLL